MDVAKKLSFLKKMQMTSDYFTDIIYLEISTSSEPFAVP